MSRAVEDCLLTRGPAQSDRAGGESPFAYGESAVPKKNRHGQRFVPVFAACAFALAGWLFSEEASAQVNHPPSFTSANSASVAENTTAVLTVAATDPDSSDSVTFSLSGGADQSKFSIVAATGALSFSSAPDFENPTDVGDTAGNNTYVVEVTATSGAGGRAMTATQTITVTVTNVNEAPAFTSSSTKSVAENTTAVLTVAATDPDSSDSVTFSLSGGADQSKFSLSGTALSFSSAPDFENPTDAGDTAQNNTYVVEVTATGGAAGRAMTATQTITVTVTNANEAPSFSASAQTRAVNENTAAGQNIGAVLPAATDPDADTTLTYSLQGTDKDSFTLSGRQLKTKAALDYEGTKKQYSVTLRASDGTLSADLGVTINVTDVNEAPAFTSSSTKSVAENTTAVLTVAATDPDSSDSVTFSLSGGADQSKFSLSGTALRFSAAPDFENPTDTGDTAENNTYVVEVTATGGTGGRAMTATQTITVTVTNVNEAPEFSASAQTRSVAENTGAGEDIGAVLPAATDPEGTALTYSLGGADANSFTLGSGRQLKTKAALNYEDDTSHSVTLIASDGNNTDTLAVTINVTDVNEAPAFANDSVTRAVDENTATNTEFGDAVAATDPDAGNTLTYTLGGTDSASFGINANTGRLKTKAALNFENDNSYTVTVTASDGQTPALTDTATVTINVGDVDEPPNPPASPTVSAQTSSRITVGWTAPSNTGRPAITGYKLSWTTSKADPVTPVPTSPVALAASATSAVVRGLDPATTYTFSIVATNDEGDGAAATVNGTTGANRAPVPDDASPEFSIAENSAANVAVGTVSAVDPETDADDNNRPVTYAMKSGDTDAFNLNTNTGQLTTKAFDYNYEADAEYNLVVSANDVHGGSADIAVTVNLTNVGGEVPEAPDSPGLNRDASTRVLVTYTVPVNPGPAITAYSVQRRRTDTDPVGSWSSSGCVLPPNLVNTFDCRNLAANGEYEFQVRATNADGAGAWSGSSMTDNDPPVFDEDLEDKSWSVPENTGTGVNVGDPVTATDPDAKSVSYYLERFRTGDSAPPFTIGATSGQLATKTGHTYDHEARSVYAFYVVAKDADGATARFFVRVSVTDVDEPPTSVPASLTVTASPGGRFAVSWSAAADDDQKPPITGYDIRYRTPYGSGTWQTHKSTGTQLAPGGNVPATTTTITGLTAGSEYQVQIAARNDEGADAWSDSVRATAIGNQLPSFTEGSSTTRSLAENTPAGRDVGAAVAATDQDGGTLAYSLEGTDADSFTIGGGNGQIRTKAGITYNFEANATYEVTVRVNDGQGGQATIDVTISLTDVDEDLVAPGAPTFPASTDTTLTVEWTPPEDTGSPVTGYIVQYRVAVGNENWRSVRPTGTETTVKITGLTAEDGIEVRVRSVHGSESSPWSETSDIVLGETTITFKDGSSASREVPENTAADVAVGADIEANINGFPLSVIGFSLEGADAEAFALVGPSIAPTTPPYGSARLVTTDTGYNHEEKSSYSVTVVATAGIVTARLPVDIDVLDDDTEAPSAPPRPSVQPASLTSLTVTWVEPANAGPEITTYNVQYKTQGAATWTPLNNLGTGLTTTIASLTEGTTYEVQVQAVNAEGTGDWSESGTGEPGNPVSNVLPVFDESSPVTRQVPENSGAGVNVGSPVTATDEGTSIEYGLEGADGSAFTITDTGQIQTTGAGYDHEAKSSYAVTVTATDDRDGVSRLDVTIEVEDLPEAPDAPGTPSVAVESPVSVTATWTAPADNAGRPPITRYQVQYRTPPSTGAWQDWSHPGTALTATITGLESGTTYEVQVRAMNNDGTNDAELPGPWSDTGTASTTPNQPPAFTAGTSTSRSLAENPGVGVAIGAAVAATDPENHPITYSLEGTDADSFRIDGDGVLRTIATAVYNFEAKATYSLDVVATDEFGAAARIAVTVTLTDVAEALSADNASASETAGTMVFTVRRVAAGNPASVAWRTVDGTATAGQDYTAASGTLTFAANETEQTIRVTLLDDEVSEGEETFAVTLDDPDNETVVRALGTIVDDDPEPGVSIAAATADEGAGTMIFPVTLSAVRENDEVTVAWETSDGTATAGPDYAAADGTLTFAPGETEQTITVTLLDDEVSEDDETFTVTLSDPVNVTITTATANGTIVDNDGDVAPPVEVLLSAAVSRVLEGLQLALTVTLSADPQRDVTVPLVATPGTAGPDDYALSATSVTFGRGETAKTVIVSALTDDLEDEPDETVRLAVGADLPARVTAGARAETEVTIENRTRLAADVQAWTARFGRTVGTHVTDAVGERLRGGPEQGSHLTVGGYRLPLEQQQADQLRSPDGSEPAPKSLSPGGSGQGEGGEQALAAKLWGPLATDAAAEPSGRLTTVLTEAARVLGMGPGAGEPAPDSPWLNGPGPDPRLGQSRTLDFGQTVTLRQVLLGSAFRLNLNGTEAGTASPRLTAWGRFAGTTFDGQDGALAVDGDVFTGTVGVDSEWERLLAGVAVAHSRGDGSFMTPNMEDQGPGGVEQTMTSLHPYVRYAVTDRLDVWGLAGYGWGELDLEMANGTTLETDTTLLMGAFGGRGIVLAPADAGGFQLATRTDAMLTRTSADATVGMASSEADAHRLRVILEGSRAVAWADGRRLTPTVEVGLRHDWGDAETGFGLEVGGRVQYADPGLGLTVEGAVRGLLAHEDADYQEWGASGTVRVAPGAGGQGLSLTLAPTWGAASSGVEGLWSRQTTQGLAPQGRTQAPGGRLQAEVGYGFAAFDMGLLTPYAGTVLAEGVDRTYRVGTRLQMTGRWATGLMLNLEGTRQAAAAGQQPVNQGVQVQATWGF